MKLIELVGKFINIYPKPFKRQIITDFYTMNTELVNIELGPFAINQYPVTNKEYHEFIRETGYSPVTKTDYLNHWKNMTPPNLRKRHPVVFVSYDDALAYADFIGGRLPTIQEWLYAAFGHENRRYPWGDDFNAKLCNVRESGKRGTTQVGFYSPKGDSPFGCADMIGNVWEWTSMAIDQEGEILLAMGTGWDHYSRQIEIPLNRWYRNHSVGFRIVMDI